MPEDVRKLMRVAGWQEGAYVEVAAAQGAADATAAWPLLAMVNSRLQARAAAPGIATEPADPFTDAAEGGR